MKKTDKKKEQEPIQSLAYEDEQEFVEALEDYFRHSAINRRYALPHWIV